MPRTFVVSILALVIASACTGDPVPDSSPTAASNGDTAGIVATDERAITEAERVLGDVVAGEYGKVRMRFNAELSVRLSEQALRNAWDMYRDRFGDYEASGDADVVRRGDLTVVSMALRMSREPGQFRVTFDEDGRIAGLFLLEERVPVS